MSDCVFCRILSGALPGSVVHQDEVATVLLDIRPINSGHMLVLPNRHATCLEELDEDAAGHLFRLARRVAAALRESGIRCEGVNFLLSDGEVAGQEVPHVHLHVLPRYQGDTFEYRVSERVPAFPSRSELDETAARIHAKLVVPPLPPAWPVAQL